MMRDRTQCEREKRDFIHLYFQFIGMLMSDCKGKVYTQIKTINNSTTVGVIINHPNGSDVYHGVPKETMDTKYQKIF